MQQKKTFGKKQKKSINLSCKMQHKILHKMQATLNYNINFELKFLQILTKTYNTVKIIAGIIGIVLFTFLLFPVLFPILLLYFNINNKRRLERFKKIFDESSDSEKINLYLFFIDFYLFLKNEDILNFFLWRNYLKMIKDFLEYIENNYNALIIQSLFIDEQQVEKVIFNDKRDISNYLINIPPIKNNETYIASHSILEDWNDPVNDHWDKY